MNPFVARFAHTVLALCLIPPIIAPRLATAGVIELKSKSLTGEREAKPAFIDRLLARLMQAESGGRRFAKNPRSSALGPFQFINSTFLDVVRRNFPGEVAKRSVAEILYLRTDPKFAMRAAKAFANENAAFLLDHGFEATMVSLHLAHFAGPTGAVRVLRAGPDALVSGLMSQAAMNANPFMSGMTVQDLINHLSRGYDGSAQWKRTKAADGCPQKPKLRVRCNRRLPSCRRWIVLHQRILDRRWTRRVAARPELCKPTEKGPAQARQSRAPIKGKTPEPPSKNRLIN